MPRSISMIVRLFLLAFLCLGSVSYAAGVHVHGEGQLQVAVEKQSLDILLTIPAMDLVGFEHAPSSAAQKAAVQAAQDRLQDASTVVALPTEARCELQSAKVSSELLSALEGHGHHHGDKKHGHGHQHKHDHKHQHKHDHPEHDDHPHADFSISYHYQCAQPEALSLLTLVLLKDFPALSLKADLVSDRGVRSDVLTAATPQLALIPGR